MQRLASSRRLLQAALAPGRAHSSLSAAAVAAAPENGAGAPKMPPFAYTPPPYDGPRVAEIAQKRAQFLSPSLFHFYDRPVYLFDEDGRRYLDAFGGIATVCCGHCHPDVIEAIVNQAKKIQHSTVLYLNHAIADFAEALASKMPEIAKVLTRRSYFNTFGGNPVSTAAGHAVLKVLEKEKLQENAFVVGSYLKEKLNAIRLLAVIGDVRGKGLLLGVELVTDRQKKTPIIKFFF